MLGVKATLALLRDVCCPPVGKRWRQDFARVAATFSIYARIRKAISTNIVPLPGSPAGTYFEVAKQMIREEGMPKVFVFDFTAGQNITHSSEQRLGQTPAIRLSHSFGHRLCNSDLLAFRLLCQYFNAIAFSHFPSARGENQCDSSASVGHCRRRLDCQTQVSVTFASSSEHGGRPS